jgi:hypothetical protein
VAYYQVEMKDPSDFKRIEADYWMLDSTTGAGWFDFYHEVEGDDDDILLVTIRASDVRSIKLSELPNFH